MNERTARAGLGAQARHWATVSLVGGLLAAAACAGSGPDEPPAIDAGPSRDAATTSRDATSPIDATGETGPGDATLGDTGFAADANDADAPDVDADDPDATVEASTADTGADGEAIAIDAAATCADLLGALLSGPIMPPGRWFGLDLTGAPDAGVPAPTIDQLGVLGCAASVDPDVVPADASPPAPGYRTASFAASPDAGSAAPVISLEYNLESRAIYQPVAYAGYGGALAFHSRAGGAYGTHQYVISVQSPDDAGSGAVLRDGLSLPADWSDSIGNAWLNELFDGLMATFAPAWPAVDDCAVSTFENATFGLPTLSTDCLFISGTSGNLGYIGVRPLDLYLVFAPGSNQVVLLYSFMPGGAAQKCATPRAALEAMTYAGIYPNGAGVEIGGISTAAVHSTAAGLTLAEANSVLGCSGVPFAPPDDGYAGMAWGGGILTMEYDPATDVNYKVSVQAGYKGLLQIQTAPQDDAGVAYYQIGVGLLQLGAVDDAGVSVAYGDIAIDWTSATTADPVVTGIANAWYAYACGAPPDTDCLAQGDCAIVVNDGSGHSTFTIAPTGTAGAGAFCQGYTSPITFVFPQGSSVPASISVVNAGGYIAAPASGDAGPPPPWCAGLDASAEYDASGYDGGSFSFMEVGSFPAGTSGALPGPAPGVCSGGGTTAASLTVTSNAPCPIELWWVDYFCRELFIQEVPAGGGSIVEGSYETHRWRLRASGTNELLVDIPALTATSPSVTYP